MHDQAEDRCHRIGQHDAVTAWYLLAAEHDRRDDGRADRSASAAIVAAVTDGRRLDGDGLVEAVVRELRDGRPFRHLKAVTEPAAATWAQRGRRGGRYSVPRRRSGCPAPAPRYGRGRARPTSTLSSCSGTFSPRSGPRAS